MNKFATTYFIAPSHRDKILIDGLINLYGKPNSIEYSKEEDGYYIEVRYPENKLLMLQGSEDLQNMLKEYWEYKIKHLEQEK